MDRTMILSVPLILQLVNDEKIPMDKYLINDKGLVQYIMREYGKLFQVLVVPIHLR